MKDAAARFVGTHDFTVVRGFHGFRKTTTKERNMAARDFFSAELRRTEDGEELWFTVHGRSFLAIIWCARWWGALLEVGRGKLVSGGYREAV